MKGAYVLISLIILIILIKYMSKKNKPPLMHNTYNQMAGGLGFDLTAAEKERLSPNKGFDDYLKAAESGVIKGCIYGYLLGDSITSAIAPALAYGTISPFMLYMGY